MKPAPLFLASIALAALGSVAENSAHARTVAVRTAAQDEESRGLFAKRLDTSFGLAFAVTHSRLKPEHREAFEGAVGTAIVQGGNEFTGFKSAVLADWGKGEQEEAHALGFGTVVVVKKVDVRHGRPQTQTLREITGGNPIRVKTRAAEVTVEAEIWRRGADGEWSLGERFDVSEVQRRGPDQQITRDGGRTQDFTAPLGPCVEEAARRTAGRAVELERLASLAPVGFEPRTWVPALTVAQAAEYYRRLSETRMEGTDLPWRTLLEVGVERWRGAAGDASVAPLAASIGACFLCRTEAYVRVSRILGSDEPPRTRQDVTRIEADPRAVPESVGEAQLCLEEDAAWLAGLEFRTVGRRAVGLLIRREHAPENLIVDAECASTLLWNTFVFDEAFADSAEHSRVVGRIRGAGYLVQPDPAKAPKLVERAKPGEFDAATLLAWLAEYSDTAGSGAPGAR